MLPSYIGYTEREGSGVFDPIEQTGVSYAFYAVDKLLRVDIDSFKAQLGSGKIRLALIIHYFGFCKNDFKQIAALCKAHNVLLVEDCAHAFQIGLEPQSLGTNGDFSFYSMHKYLATKSGGILQVNNPDYTIPDVADELKISMNVLEQFAKTDIPAVARHRRDNYKLYYCLLKELDGISLMYELGEDDIPHNFPIKVKGGKREALYFYLADKGLTVIALYYRLIDQIAQNEFPVSFTVSNEILNLPVHQDINTADVHLICDTIKEFFNQPLKNNG